MSTQSKSSASESATRLLDSLRFVAVLSSVPEEKRIAIHAKDAEDRDAILVLDKKPFDVAAIGSAFAHCNRAERRRVDVSLQNDIYSDLSVVFKSSDDASAESLFNSLKGILIYPASEKHMRKHRQVPLHLVRESGHQFSNVTKPFLERGEMFAAHWVENILTGRTESERVVVDNPDSDVGYVILPDLKWNAGDLTTLYLMAIVRRGDITSIRDLRAEHLPLLRSLRSGAIEAGEKLGLARTQLRMSFHYPPSYWHLHLHITNCCYSPGGQRVEKAHLLDDVIENIESDSDYYKKRTITIALPENDPLLPLLQADG